MNSGGGSGQRPKFTKVHTVSAISTARAAPTNRDESHVEKQPSKAWHERGAVGKFFRRFHLLARSETFQAVVLAGLPRRLRLPAATDLMSARGGKRKLSKGCLNRAGRNTFVLRPANQIFSLVAVQRLIRPKQGNKRPEIPLFGKRQALDSIPKHVKQALIARRFALVESRQDLSAQLFGRVMMPGQAAGDLVRSRSQKTGIYVV